MEHGLPGRLQDLFAGLSRKQEVRAGGPDLPERPVAEEVAPADLLPRQAEGGGGFRDQAEEQGATRDVAVDLRETACRHPGFESLQVLPLGGLFASVAEAAHESEDLFLPPGEELQLADQALARLSLGRELAGRRPQVAAVAPPVLRAHGEDQGDANRLQVVEEVLQSGSATEERGFVEAVEHQRTGEAGVLEQVLGDRAQHPLVDSRSSGPQSGKSRSELMQRARRTLAADTSWVMTEPGT